MFHYFSLTNYDSRKINESSLSLEENLMPNITCWENIVTNSMLNILNGHFGMCNENILSARTIGVGCWFCKGSIFRPPPKGYVAMIRCLWTSISVFPFVVSSSTLSKGSLCKLSCCQSLERWLERFRWNYAACDHFWWDQCLTVYQ